MRASTYCAITDLTDAIERFVEAKIAARLAPTEETKTEVELAYSDLHRTVGKIANGLEADIDEAGEEQKS